MYKTINLIMRNAILTIFLFCAISVNAQENRIQDYIIPDNIVNLIPNAKESNRSPIQNRIEYKHLLPKNMLVPNNYQLNLKKYAYRLKQNVSYMLYNNSDVLYGFGCSYEAGGLLIYQPFDKLTYSIGASTVKYSMNGSLYNDYLFNSSMTYQFNNRLKLYIYGQYSVNSQKNTLAGGYNLSPQNCYGAILMIKVLDSKKYSIDMNIGAERSYNPLNKNWEMNYRLGPDIRLK